MRRISDQLSRIASIREKKPAACGPPGENLLPKSIKSDFNSVDAANLHRTFHTYNHTKLRSQLTSRTLRICTPSNPLKPCPNPTLRERTKRFILTDISHSNLSKMPNNTTQFTEGIRSERPCRVCQVQLVLEWGKEVFFLLYGWERSTTLFNKALWGALSVGMMYSLYMVSDEPYYCGEGRQIRPGRHFWEREAEADGEFMEKVVNGSQRLAAWFRERCSSSQLCNSTPEPEADVDHDLCDVSSQLCDGTPEPEADGDYDLCDVE